jgi:hypothetical protein
MKPSLPAATAPVRDPMTFEDYWTYLLSHAECCESMARTMLIAEGATPDEVDDIFGNPDQWVARHGHLFNENLATRQAMSTSYDPLRDADLFRSMRALNSQAVVWTISAVSHLSYFRTAQASVDVFSASASVLAAWNLLFVAGTELATGERAFAVAQAPRLVGAKGNAVRWKNDPKVAQKEQVRQCWKAWQQKPTAYRGKAAFARGMLDKYEHLESQKKIEDWCREWEKGEKPLELSR